MNPSTIVSNIAHDARITRSVAPIYMPEGPESNPYRPEGNVAALPRASALVPVQPETEFKRVREDNTKQLMKSNYWFEVTNILRWCTTALIGATFLSIFSVAGLSTSTITGMTAMEIAGGVGAAFLSAPVLLSLGALSIAAFATVKASQHSRKIMAEKTFDVQETFVQRQAGLIADSVEHVAHPEAGRQAKSWVERAAVDASQQLAESTGATR